MEDMFSEKRNGKKSFGNSFSVRELLDIMFRRRRVVGYSFCGLLAGVLLAILFISPTYEAQMEIFLDHKRVDPVVSTEANVMQQASGLTEDEVASEVQLFLSRDSLEKAVIDNNLYETKNPSLLQSIVLHVKGALGLNPDRETRVYRAVLAMEKNVQVIPVNNSNVLQITYDSRSPQVAANVLSELGNLYLEKHAAVRSSAGTADLFAKQADQFKKHLEDTEEKLVSFDQQSGAVSADYVKQATLQKVSDFGIALTQTRADVAQTQARIRDLDKQMGVLPSRVTTQEKVADNPQLMADLKSTLLNLEIKRTELLERYDPQYPLVQEVEKQIAESHAAIAEAEKAGSHEQITDQNPTNQWVRTELAKDKADLVGYEARAQAMSQALGQMQKKVLQLDRDSQTQQNLMRMAKADESDYLLYNQKAEQARIDDVLNQKGILNASISEQPIIPKVPVGLPTGAKLLLGLIVAVLFSFGIGFLVEYLDPSFRTPRDVEETLEIPLVAAIPRNGH